MTRALVTGAAGFLGSRVVRRLLQRGDEVYAVVRPGASVSRLESAAENVAFVFADLADIEAAAVQKINPDITLHLAWYTKPSAYLHAAQENLQSLEATIRLMRFLAESGCPRVVLAGSCLETLPNAPPSIYAASKRAAHLMAGQLAPTGVSAACGHIFYLYGPGESPDRIIPLVIRKLLYGEEVKVTAGEQRRDYLHVDDAAAALCDLAASELTGGVDICSGSPVELRKVFQAIGEETGRPDLIKVGERPYGKDEVFVAAGDPAPLAQIGWMPSRTLRTGIKETVAWWTQQDLAQRPMGSPF